MLLAYSYEKVRKILKPLIEEQLGIKVQSYHRISTQSIVKDLIPLNKGRNDWVRLWNEHMPYYFIYGMNKKNWSMVKTHEQHKLERIVIRIIHRNIPIELLPLDAQNMPKSFEDLHIHNYILFYCLLAFSGNWGWLIQEMELIEAKVPGISELHWVSYYTKYSTLFRKLWKIDLDI
jgi:hypothetical protein